MRLGLAPTSLKFRSRMSMSECEHCEQQESEFPELGSDLRQRAEIMLNSLHKKGEITDNEKQEGIEEIYREKRFGIMACGVTGAGKSTLLNGIAGECVFKEGDRLQHETVAVKKHTVTKHNSHLIVRDTPGFSDSSGDERNYVSNISDTCEDVDLLLYCISMGKPKARMDDYDLKTLKSLKKVLKEEIWQHCIVVLTFANAEVARLEQKKVAKIEQEFRTYGRERLGRFSLTPELIPPIFQ